MEKIDESFGYLKFTLKMLKNATDCFHEKNIIGKGSFGSVYKASLPIPNLDRQLSGHPIATLAVAIKRGNAKFVQGESKYENVEQIRKYEFEMEIRLLSRFKHRNIVSLIGYCHEDDEMILVYGYTLNKSLDACLESTKSGTSSLTWAQRLKICIGVANGLEYLHLGYVDQAKAAVLRGVHGDIKSANILLDQNFQAVIGDFGLSTFSPPKKQLISSFKYRRAGTPGFIDPYHVKTGMLSEKVDVYSFGVLLLEVLSGKSASSQFRDKRSTQVQAKLIISELKERIRKNAISFPGTEANNDTSRAFLDLADRCLQDDPAIRPKMTDIKRELENLLKIRIGSLNLRVALEDIKKATKNFENSMIIGWGESARVYKGELFPTPGGNKMVAIKRFNRQMQTEVEFLIDILMLNDYKHQNVIAVQGFHYGENEKIVIYEYAFHGNLDNYLSNTRNKFSLTWNQRLKICLGAAQGLCFIHTCGLLDGIVHGDVKSANILLTHNFEAKISNFGLSKWARKNVASFLLASGAGTLGYSDPAYTKTGVLTKASDVYSFGAVMFEVLGKRLVLENDCYYGEQVEETKKHKVEDRNNVEEIDSQTFTIVSAVTRHCMQERPEDRPTMGHVVQELSKALDFLDNRVD